MDVIDWLIDWLIDFPLIDWLIDFCDWLIDWLIDFCDWFFDWLIDFLVDWLIDWLIFPLIEWFFGRLIDWFLWLELWSTYRFVVDARPVDRNVNAALSLRPHLSADYFPRFVSFISRLHTGPKFLFFFDRQILANALILLWRCKLISPIMPLPSPPEYTQSLFIWRSFFESISSKVRVKPKQNNMMSVSRVFARMSSSYAARPEQKIAGIFGALMNRGQVILSPSFLPGFFFLTSFSFLSRP